MNEILNNLDKSLLDEDTLKLLELDVDSIEQQKVIPGENLTEAEIIENDNQYVQNELGISMDAIQSGLDLRAKREEEGLDAYYEDVYTNIIKPNKNWSNTIYQDGLKLLLEKNEGNVTPGFVDEGTLFEVAKPFIDNMYDYNPDVQSAFLNYKKMIEDTTSGKEAMLLSGISDEVSMDVLPRLIVETLGPNQSIDLKKSLLNTVLQKNNPDSSVEVGTFAELSQGIYKGDTPDALAYRIDGGAIIPVNVPGLDTKDLSLFLRELPNVTASIAAGATMIASGYGIPATAAASATAVAITELATNAYGFAYEKMHTTGDVTTDEIEAFLKDASKDVAFAAALEGTFGVVIPGLATVIKRTMKRGAVAPGKLRKAYEDGIKAGDKGGEKAAKDLAKINKIMTDRLGKNPNNPDGTWIDLNILQAFKGSIPATQKASQVLSNQGLTAIDLAATNIVKQTSEAFQQVFAKNIDEGMITPGMLPDFTASPSILFGDAFQKIAGQMGEASLKDVDALFTKPLDELTAILNVLNKSDVLENPNAVFDKSMISGSGQEILEKLIQNGNTNIASIFEVAGVKLTDEVIRPLNLRTTAYQFLKSIDDGLLKNLDEPQQNALKEIVKKLSVYTKSTPGPGKLKDLSYNQVDSILNQLNEMIDNPSLYGGLGKNNKTLIMAGALREDLEKGLRKALGDDNWLKIKGQRSELKSVNDLRKGELFKKILKSDEFFTDQNGGAFFKSVKNNSKVLAQMNSVFNRMPSLSDQKRLFKMGILEDLTDAINGPTGDALEMAIKNKDFKFINSAYKTWMKANRKNISQFFTKEEMKLLDTNGIKATNYLETLTKRRGAEMDHVKQFTGKLQAMDAQALLGFFKKSPEQFKKFYEEGIKKGIFDKEAMTNFKKYVAMTFNNKTMASQGDGLFLYDPDLMIKEILDAPDFYRNVFGKQWLDDASEMANFLRQYYSPIKTLISGGDNQAARAALQNVFMGQLDRKRTFIRGTLNLLGMFDARDFAKYVNFKDFKKGYDNAYLSKTARTILEPLNSMYASDQRINEEKGEATLTNMGEKAVQLTGLGMGAVDKLAGVGADILGLGE